MDQYRVKRCLAGVGQTREDHAGHPEADDVIAGDQRVRGVEVVVILGVLVGPAQRGERPQGRAEPGVQRVGVLGHVGAAALGAGAGGFLGHDGLAAVVAVPGGDLVAPPQLAADAPVTAALHPVDIVLGEALGHELDLALLDALDGGLGQRLHLDEPLLGDHRLNDRVAAVAGAHVVGQRLGLLQRTAGLQIGQNSLAGLQRGHAGILAAVQHVRLVGSSAARGLLGIDGGLVGSAGHVAVVGQHTDHRQVVALADLKVVGVVGGGDLHNAGALLHVGVLVADDGDFAAQQRQHDMAAVQVLVARVLGVDGNSGITQHRLGAGRGQLQHFAGLLDGVEQMPEAALLGLILDLGVGNRGVAVGAPVDHAVAAVDQPLVVQTDKDLLDGVGAALIHREALALPVAGAAQLLQLADDAVAIGVLPVPGTLQKAVAAHHLLGQALLAHFGDDLGLGGNGRMVGAGHPQRGIALHPLVAGQDVLPGLIHGVAHVQLAGDVRRRHDDGKRLFAAVDLGMEIPLVAPVLIDAILGALRGILFGEFLRHSVNLLVNVRGVIFTFGQNKKGRPMSLSWDGLKSSSRGTTQVARSGRFAAGRQARLP